VQKTIRVTAVALATLAAVVLACWSLQAHNYSIYFLYPPGLIPRDPNCEAQRVLREIDTIEAQTLDFAEPRVDSK
jgi:hypothetical protein